MLGRLAGYSTHSESHVFQYDANGNRTVKTDNGLSTLCGIQADNNRLVSMGSMSHTLDANGNLLNDGEQRHISTGKSNSLPLELNYPNSVPKAD